MFIEKCVGRPNTIVASKVLLFEHHVYHLSLDSLNNLDTKRQMLQSATQQKSDRHLSSLHSVGRSRKENRQQTRE